MILRQDRSGWASGEPLLQVQALRFPGKKTVFCQPQSLGLFGPPFLPSVLGFFVVRCQASVTQAEVGPYCGIDLLKYVFH